MNLDSLRSPCRMLSGPGADLVPSLKKLEWGVRHSTVPSPLKRPRNSKWYFPFYADWIFRLRYPHASRGSLKNIPQFDPGQPRNFGANDPYPEPHEWLLDPFFRRHRDLWAGPAVSSEGGIGEP